MIHIYLQCMTSSRDRLGDALFGIRDGRVWVSDEAFVSREGEGLLVERWAGARIISILVRPDLNGCAREIWEKLDELAIGY